MPTGNSLPDQLRAWPAERLAGLLTRVPVLRHALEGHGPLAGVSPYGLAYPPQLRTGHRTIERLATLLSSPIGIDACLASLDRTARDLVTLAVWHGGALSREQALAEVAACGVDPDAIAPRLDDAAAALAAALLTEPAAGWVVLRPGVAGVADLPGVLARPSLEQAPSSALQQALRNHGVRRPPSRKQERVDALEALLRDGDAVRAAVQGLSDDARRLVHRLVRDGPQTLRDLGVVAYEPWDRTATPLRELEALCLVGVDYADQECWAWLDVVVALGGGVVPDWPPPPDVETAAVRDPGGLPEVIGRLAALVALWRAQPAPALAGGGIGVRPVRAAAKQLGVPAGHVGLLTNLAVDLGLLGQVPAGPTGHGRGRAASERLAWAPTARAEDFEALPAERRWALLVQAWHDAEDLDETEGLPERLESSAWYGATVARGALLDLLAELPPGAGLHADDLAAAAAHRYPALLSAPVAANLTEAARALGLVPPDGPVGLTGLGRALLDGPEALAAALPSPATSFVVQADLSVVAPPDLAPDLGGRLERYAELESAAGARLYRLSETRLAAALDAGERDEDILGFLDAHSTAPLAQNVVYLVRDVARRHGRVRAGACSSYVRSDDPALLSRAVAVKGAELRALAPTVAVSGLPRDTVVAALRAKGLMPVAEDADGLALRPTVTAPADGADLPELRERLAGCAAHAQLLAAELLATPPPRTGRDGLGPAATAASLLDPWDDVDLEDEEWVELDVEWLARGREALQSLLAEVQQRGGRR
ncbi:MAG TPA: helicase-associated domain-containing protein [Egibacteraceae bacterium]|nr:helicase-associated domain-containing protein [Egibacteraceae bacterium]